MQDKVKKFLESGQLELYVYGMLDAAENTTVAEMIAAHPSIQKEYQKLQSQLEENAAKQAQPAPSGLKSQILAEIDNKESVIKNSKILNQTKWLAAASFIGLIGMTALAWTLNSNVNQSNNTLAEITQDCNHRKQIIDSQAALISFYESENTVKSDLIGNSLNSNYKAIAYTNKELGILKYITTSKPNLPEGKCLQLWGDLDGKMIPIAVLSNTNDRNVFDIKEGYTSLNVTIENLTESGDGQDHPDVSNLIANVLI